MNRKDALREVLGELISPRKLAEIEQLYAQDDALETLRRLVQQIQGSGYRDTLGHAIEMNVAFRDAVALLSLRSPDHQRDEPRGT